MYSPARRRCQATRCDSYQAQGLREHTAELEPAFTIEIALFNDDPSMTCLIMTSACVGWNTYSADTKTRAHERTFQHKRMSCDICHDSLRQQKPMLKLRFLFFVSAVRILQAIKDAIQDSPWSRHRQKAFLRAPSPNGPLDQHQKNLLRSHLCPL